MTCVGCGGEVRVPSTAPGTFFRIGLGALLVAVAALAWAAWVPAAPTLVPVLAWTGLGVAVVSAAATWTAMIDARSMGRDGSAERGRRCAACGHVSPLRPWSR